VYLGGPLKEKCLGIRNTLGLFENKEFTHYNCCWRPLWKRSSLLIHNVAVGPHWKQGTLHIRVAKCGRRQVPRLPSLTWTHHCV